MTSHVEQAVAARIQAAKRRTEDMRRQRAELAAARAAGLAKRHAARLRHQNQAAEDTDVKTYSRHSCSQRHDSWAALAGCIWRAATITGDGPFAAVACRAQAVTLYPVLDQAQGRRRAYDRDGCGPDCARRHQLIVLDPGPVSGAAA